MTNLGINYVAADEGGLIFGIDTEAGTINRRADTIVDGVEFVKKYGVADAVYGSSSMDFAAEEGFADDDGAMNMWNRILEAS